MKIKEFSVLYDKEDEPLVREYKWYVSVSHDKYPYAAAYSKERLVLMHRLICNTPKKMFTDHVNGNTLDNRRANLRACTNSQNQANSAKKKNNKSGYKGVVQVTKNRWLAKINKDNKRRSLGWFDNPVDAAKAYDKAARELHGQFARTNF